MKIFETGTGYTSIPAKIGAATEIIVEELTRSMTRKNYDVTILDIKDKNRQPNNLPIQEVYVPKTLRSTDTKLGVIHKLKRVIYSVSLSLKLISIINKKETTILHFHNQYNLYFFLKISSKKTRKNTKIIYTNHSFIWYGKWEEIKNIINKRYFQEVYCMKNADKTFVLNEVTIDHLVNQLNIPREKIVLIPNGVNTEKYIQLQANDPMVSDLRTKFDLEGKRVFVQIGSVCERKNQLDTVQTLLTLLKEDPTIAFAFAGGIIDREYFQSILDLSKEEGIENQVIYLGEVAPGKDLNCIYNLATASIFNSISEAFGLVIIESLSAGTPVLISSQLSTRLNIFGQKENGIIQYENKDELSFVIKNEIFSPVNREKYSAAGRNFAVKNYSWDTITDLYLENL